MLGKSPNSPQLSLFDLMGQLDHDEPLLKLGKELDWDTPKTQFSSLYSPEGRRSKPIRLMAGMLIHKQLNNLSNEQVVIAVKQNPYYQSFCGFDEFQLRPPCDTTKLVKFRNRTYNRPLMRDSVYERHYKRTLCKRSEAIEPLIGHLRHDHFLFAWKRRPKVVCYGNN